MTLYYMHLVHICLTANMQITTMKSNPERLWYVKLQKCWGVNMAYSSVFTHHRRNNYTY